MTSVVGRAGLAMALMAAAAGGVTMLVGLRTGSRVARRHVVTYCIGVAAGVALAVGAMQWALVGHDFSIAYVARNGSRSTPLLYTVASMWGALEGSILLWALVLVGYLLAVLHRFRDRLDDPLVGWALVALLAVTAFFLGLLVGPANPFSLTAPPIPTDGPGPNPLLQNHILMAVHPPMLYLGYVGFTVPYAFAVGALVTGRLDEGWLHVTRRFTLWAWGFLSLGIVMGAWWSYEVLGWGGFWAWDPVENASFLPWLTGTAYLHSVVMQERRGMLRVWNLSLVVSTFSLTLLGTFLTRSGVLDSVHAFSDSTIGPLLLGAFGVVVVTALGLIAWRGDRLRTPGRIDSPRSREAAFLANNLVFSVFAFMVLLGTLFPLLVEAVNGDRLSVGGPYFNRMAGPLGFALLFLMAVAPVLPWRKASGELLSDRLRVPAAIGAATLVVGVVAGARGLVPLIGFGMAGFAAGGALRQIVISVRANGVWGLVGRSSGGMVVHLGIVLIALAFTASQSYSTSADLRLKPGQSARVAGHTVTYLGLERAKLPNKSVVTARVRVDGGKVYRPALNTFPFATQTIGTPSVRSTLVDDVYLTLQAVPTSSRSAALIGVIVEPMVIWLWIGGFVMFFGTALALVPTRSRRRPSPSPPDREPMSAVEPVAA